LPAVDEEFVQMSAARAWGLTPAEWRRQSADDRARMIAHEIIAGVREAHYYEQTASEGAPGRSKYVDPLWEQMKGRVGAKRET
jgi:hypothetical protein